MVTIPRKGNVVIGVLDEVGETTVKIESVVYKVAESPQRFLKKYKPGQQVYLSLKGETVSYMKDYNDWKAEFPSKAQALAMNTFAEKIESAAEKLSTATPSVSSGIRSTGTMGDDLRIMNSAAACATGLVKSMIEKGLIDTDKEIRTTMNQMMVAIYTDQKQILGGN